MFWGVVKLWMISAKKVKKINDQTKDESEKDQIAIIACYAIEKILIKQRRLNTIETKDENFIAGNTADEENFVTINNEAVKEINVVNTVNDITNEKDVNVVTVFDAVNEKKQNLLTSLL